MQPATSTNQTHKQSFEMFVKTTTDFTLTLLRLEMRNGAIVLIIKKCYGFYLNHVITTAATKTSSPWAVTLSWQNSYISNVTCKPSKLRHTDLVRGL